MYFAHIIVFWISVFLLPAFHSFPFKMFNLLLTRNMTRTRHYLSMENPLNNYYFLSLKGDSSIFILTFTFSWTFFPRHFDTTLLFYFTLNDVDYIDISFSFTNSSLIGCFLSTNLILHERAEQVAIEFVQQR